MLPDRETLDLSDFEEGVLVGVLAGEGHFGGDGCQPHVTLRMHTDNEALFRWIEKAVPGSKLYGPYTHGGRSYFQWMCRGRPLAELLMPLLERRMRPETAGRAYGRFLEMRQRYKV